MMKKFRYRFGLELPLVALMAGCAIANTTVMTTPNPTSSQATAGSTGRVINPVISGLVATPTTSQPGQSISITVTANDPKGELLGYTWTATGGTLSATTGKVISWKTPQATGTYTVQVLVTNQSGGSATGALNIVVDETGSTTVSPPVFSSPDPTPSPTPTGQSTPTPPPSAPVSLRVNIGLRSSFMPQWTKAGDFEAGTYRINATGNSSWNDGDGFHLYDANGFLSSFNKGILAPSSPVQCLVARVDYLDSRQDIVEIGAAKTLLLSAPAHLNFSINTWYTPGDYIYSFYGGFDVTIAPQ